MVGRGGADRGYASLNSSDNPKIEKGFNEGGMPRDPCNDKCSDKGCGKG